MLENNNTHLCGKIMMKNGQLKIAGQEARMDTALSIPRGVQDGDRVRASGRNVVVRRNGRVAGRFFLILKIQKTK